MCNCFRTHHTVPKLVPLRTGAVPTYVVPYMGPSVYQAHVHVVTNMADKCATVTDKGHLSQARIIWDYMKLNHRCEKSDIILCLGSYDVRVADRAASLWLHGMADKLVFSGNTGKLTEGLFCEPEAEVFRDRAVALGVPVSKILTESESCNTGENVRFSYQLLCDANIYPKSVIIVQKPYMERRSFATFMKQWPGDTSGLKVYVTSPDIDMLDYPNEATGSLDDVISVMVGDFARIGLYEKKGFQIPQDIPEDAQRAFETLVQSGIYSSHMPN